MSKNISLTDIDHNLGYSGNMAGIVPSLIYGYYEDVAVWPLEPTPSEVGDVTTPLTLDEAGVLVGDVVMKSGTRAYRLDFTEDVGSFKMAPVGDVDGVHWEYDLSVIKAKIQKTILGFANAAVGRKLFFIIQDENDNRYLMGNARRGASIVSGGDGATTGTGGNDRNQMALNFKFRSRKGLIYEGDTEAVLVQVP